MVARYSTAIAAATFSSLIAGARKRAYKKDAEQEEEEAGEAV